MVRAGSDGKRPRSIEDEDEPLPGVLTDREICAAAGEGRLIAENFRAGNVQQACYELRVGSIYYDLSDGARRYVLGPEHRYVLLKPHQLIVVITKESLRLPSDVVGRILMKGKLFSLGLQPINTYADPGFAGRLGIVIHNSSPSYIKLEEGESVAKIEFERLRKPVENPYSGQHGYQTEIWPIPTHLVLNEQDLRGDPRVGSPGEELRRAYGEELGTVVDRVFRYERILLLSVLAYILVAVVVVVFTQASGDRLSTLAAFLIGLVTNIVSSVLIWLGTSLARRRKW